jgi:2-amino-4-hydroxy-6-hydroxymethyldihydropteridine diphosphokinase/dihydropteroate synthase
VIYISIGSNLGHRLNYLYQAVSLLKKHILNVQYSIILETKCILPDAAPLEWDKLFLNMIIAGDSYLSPELLLSEIKQIEFKLGRPEIYEKWAPRVIDLDILLWNDYILNKPYLKIPHPELANRPFLLHLLSTMGINREDQVIKNCFHRSYALFPRLVGIVNVTSNSFSDGGLYNTTNKAISRAIKLSEEGASIIEIGAQSTRPGAIIQSDEQEYIKLTTSQLFSEKANPKTESTNLTKLSWKFQ